MHFHNLYYYNKIIKTTYIHYSIVIRAGRHLVCYHVCLFFICIKQDSAATLGCILVSAPIVRTVSLNSVFQIPGSPQCQSCFVHGDHFREPEPQSELLTELVEQ